jgi:hypothetical protein
MGCFIRLLLHLMMQRVKPRGKLADLSGAEREYGIVSSG